MLKQPTQPDTEAESNRVVRISTISQNSSC